MEKEARLSPARECLLLMNAFFWLKKCEMVYVAGRNVAEILPFDIESGIMSAAAKYIDLPGSVKRKGE